MTYCIVSYNNNDRRAIEEEQPTTAERARHDSFLVSGCGARARDVLRVCVYPMSERTPLPLLLLLCHNGHNAAITKCAKHARTHARTNRCQLHTAAHLNMPRTLTLFQRYAKEHLRMFCLKTNCEGRKDGHAEQTTPEKPKSRSAVDWRSTSQ